MFKRRASRVVRLSYEVWRNPAVGTRDVAVE
jgi:hypothetical protein